MAKKSLLILRLFYVLATIISTQTLWAQNLSKEVNPFIGTDFTGNTYPGAQTPFGMVQLSPDNGLPGWDRISGYFYPDSTIAGFSHTHLSGTGAGDLYDISFMPVTLPYKEAPQPLGIYSSFSHHSEKAWAGYYQVMLADYHIKVELTATERCGIQRYTFPKASSAIFLNLKKAMNWDFTCDSQVKVIDHQTIEGYRFSKGWAPNQRVFFKTRFSKPFKSYHIDTTAIMDNHQRIGTAYIARFDFDTSEGEQIVLATALSGVSNEGAAINLEKEAPSNDFDRYRKDAEKDWDQQLRKILVMGNSQNTRTIFYTALYHSMLAPTLFSDVDGSYRGADGKNHKKSTANYSTFSLWDTYRAAHPLYTYLFPDKVNDMVQSFIDFYDQHGRLPVWNMYGCETDMMIGYHSVPVIVDAYLKGIGSFDAEKALEACVATANSEEYRQLKEYKKYGYVPYNIPMQGENWALSKTLEYAYDDYCIARMAEKMGKRKIADEFYKRANFYKNVFNPATGFMQPRDDKGAFLENFNPDEYNKYICESNAWQYLWSVQHDLPGLIQLLGGEKKALQRLDEMFNHSSVDKEGLPIFSTGMIGQYVQGNEPDHHVIYIYNLLGQPWKTQYYLHQVMNKFFKNTPDGLCGNEDCGQMSAWYVWSAIGMYPVNPISGRYEIGTPLFPKTVLNLPNHKKFIITAHHVSDKNFYVQEVKLNGKPLTTSYLTHEQIMKGGKLEFIMGSTKGKKWY